MAISVASSTTYDSGAGVFLPAHTKSGVDTSGTDPYLLNASFEKNPAAEVTTVTSDGNNMVKADENLFANVASIQAYIHPPADASQDVVVNTPTFKECAMILLNLNGVDQTTPYNTTTVKGDNFSTNATASITGTSGNLLIAIMACQADTTHTAVNCTVAQSFSALSGIGGCFVGYATATGSSQSLGVTLGAATNWRLLIIEFIAAGGTPPVVTLNNRMLMGVG